MSADNGIYILRTPAPPVKEGNSYINQHSKYEYRVAHCQAIENIDYSDLYLPLLFGGSQIYNEQDAAQKANEIQKQIEEDGGFTEYGIIPLCKETYFPNMTSRAARVALDCHQGAIPLDAPGEIERLA